MTRTIESLWFPGVVLSLHIITDLLFLLENDDHQDSHGGQTGTKLVLTETLNSITLPELGFMTPLLLCFVSCYRFV